MAVDSYMAFLPYGSSDPLKAESQVSFTPGNLQEELMGKPLALKPGFVFEIEDYNFDVEQTLNIGSQSSGAGAGKITFNPFSITRKIDIASPLFFRMACSGTAFQVVSLVLRKSAGVGAGAGDSSGVAFLRFDFRLVAVKTISWAHDDESPKETVTFEYGGFSVRYCQQNPNGTLQPASNVGWNRVKNVAISDFTAVDITGL